MKFIIAVLLSFLSLQTHAEECLETITTSLEKKLVKVGDCKVISVVTPEGYCNENRSEFPLFYVQSTLKVINDNCRGQVVYQGTITEKVLETKSDSHCTGSISFDQVKDLCEYNRQKYVDLLEI